jgi:hypothetical protein
MKIADIEQVIKDCGISLRFREVADRDGHGMHQHIMIYKQGLPGRSLGKLSIIRKLNEGELRNRVIAKFAHVSRKLCSIEES